MLPSLFPQSMLARSSRRPLTAGLLGNPRKSSSSRKRRCSPPYKNSPMPSTLSAFES
jgi:hypothetical protein